MRKSLILASLLVFIFASDVFAADVSGNWVLKMTGRQGEVSIDMAIKATGEDLKITGKHPSYGDMVGNGTLKGNAITMTLSTTGETKREYFSIVHDVSVSINNRVPLFINYEPVIGTR